MRSLAELFARERPDVLAVCEIDAGDALSIATRFAVQWAYRGRQALFWNDRFNARHVHDLYLPARAARPFDRRGLLRVDATYDSRPCMLAATQFSDEREGRIRELRFARAQLRQSAADAIFFAHLRYRAIAFDDLGFRDVTPDARSEERIYLRGFASGVVPKIAII